MVHSLPSQSQALEVSGDVQPTLLAAFDSPALHVVDKATDRNVKHQYSHTGALGFTSRELFLVDWHEQKPFMQVLVNNKGQEHGL